MTKPREAESAADFYLSEFRSPRSVRPQPTAGGARSFATSHRPSSASERLGASLMVVGETPGDTEDLEGRPFVGPAGKLLDEAFAEAGFERRKAYVTNVVKHFKWEPQGKRRLHKKPSAAEERTCRPWLDAEVEVVRPMVILCLGATAAQAILGKKFRITAQRGEVLSSPQCNQTIATYHPSAVLRAPDHEARERMRQALFDDVRTAIELAARD